MPNVQKTCVQCVRVPTELPFLHTNCWWLGRRAAMGHLISIVVVVVPKRGGGGREGRRGCRGVHPVPSLASLLLFPDQNTARKKTRHVVACGSYALRAGREFKSEQTRGFPTRVEVDFVIYYYYLFFFLLPNFPGATSTWRSPRRSSSPPSSRRCSG